MKKCCECKSERITYPICGDCLCDYRHAHTMLGEEGNDNMQLQAEIARLRAALEEIAYRGTDCPASRAGAEAAHYRDIAWSLIAVADKALSKEGGE
jgi:hypothetical protein